MWSMINAPNAISLPPPHSRWCPVVPHFSRSHPYRSHTTSSSNVLSQTGLMVFLWLLIISQVEQPWPWEMTGNSLNTVLAPSMTEQNISFLFFVHFVASPAIQWAPSFLNHFLLSHFSTLSVSNGTDQTTLDCCQETKKLNLLGRR